MKNLRLTKPYTRGPAIRRLQELGDLLGYDYGPNDGIFGPTTQSVAIAFQTDHGLVVDGIVGPITWGKIIYVVDGILTIAPDVKNKIFNATNHMAPKNFSHWRRANIVLGVTLHQTGCNMPQSPRGWRRCNAHYGATREALALRLNPIVAMIWHAQKLSHRTIGVEIEGNYQGVEDDPGTLWEPGGGPDVLTLDMLNATDLIFDDIYKFFEGHKQKWRVLAGHRQSSPTRRAYPGGEIWRQVALPWQKRLGIEFSPKSYGKGSPIPHEWDSRSIFNY